MESEEILTGEAVVLDVRAAGFLVRTGAALIDVAVVLSGFYLVELGLQLAGQGLFGAPDPALGAALQIAALVTIMLIVPTATETLSRGRSLGKLATGIRIVRDDGGPVRFRQAFVRALSGVFELWMTLGSVAVITSLLNDRGKRVGDYLAGTYAARVRGGTSATAPLVMPPALAGWAATADMRRLPDHLALAVRQFLGRAAKLNPASRQATGLDLAARVEKYVAPPPPLGTHPEAYLTAVLVQRREREYALSLRRRAAGDALTSRIGRLPYGIEDPVQ